MEERGRILDRIKKIMALANDRGATEGERDAAMFKVHEILAKYNLTMAEADAHGITSEEKRTGGAMDTGNRKFPHVWQRTVAGAIARLYFCDYFFEHGDRQVIMHFFVGKQSNVFTAQEMTKYVITSIEKEARQSKREVMGDGTYERNFAKGAAGVIRERCYEIRKNAEKKPAQTSSCTALVLASVYDLENKANEKFIADQMKISLKYSSMHQRSAHVAGYEEGRDFGGRINLNTQLSGRVHGKKLS